MKVLVLNAGSSSLKYQLIDMTNEEVIAKGNFERIGQGNSFLTHKVGEEKHVIESPVKDHEEAIKIILAQFTNEEYGVISDLNEIGAVGHRILHGGEKLTASTVITDEVIDVIKECIPLGPLHNPAQVKVIEACKRVMGNTPMVAVFDTAFHQTMPKEHYIYPIPYEYYEKYGIRKYGFHGTSHRFVSARVAELMGGQRDDLKVITCHLGQGASLAAVLGGKCQDTSMGLTPLAGIPMGSRCGDVDPAIVKYLMEVENLSVNDVDTILNKKSGVYGISGISPDFRDIEEAANKGNERAKLALENYNYLVAQYVGRYAVTLQGVDAIVFTAGVGENGPTTRKGICDKLKFLGVKIDDEKNNTRGQEIEISTPDSKVRVFVIPTNEELMIARDTMNLVK